MRHKYIRHPRVGFVLWPDTDNLWHSQVADQVGSSNGTRGKPYFGVISAGFAILEGGKVLCAGGSESLNLDSRDDDTDELAKQLGLLPGTRG